MDRFALEGPAEVIAHRGFSAAAPENTLSALRMAMDAGADALEFDLQVTGCGTPVVFHDDTLDRTTDGTGPVRDRLVQELEELDAGFWFDEAFEGEPIPKLSQALEMAAEWHGRLYPELKGAPKPADVDRIADEVADHGLLDRTVFIAMDWTLLHRIRSRQPDAAVGYIVKKPALTEAAISQAGGDPLALIDWEKSIPLRDRVAAARAQALRIPMAAWTVDDPGDATALLEAGVPRITTNRVDVMLRWKAGLNGS